MRIQNVKEAVLFLQKTMPNWESANKVDLSFELANRNIWRIDADVAPGVLWIRMEQIWIRIENP
jgi:hypothetical protein